MRVSEAVDRGARLAPVMDLCARCVRLYLDLVTVTAALRQSALPTRPHDLKLTADDARRLRPRGWRRWWSAVGTAGDSLTRPLAVGITTLGLAGLVVTAAPTLLPGLSGAATSEAAGAVDAHAPAASLLPGDRTPAIAGSPAETYQATAVPSAEGPLPTIVLSAGLLLAGGGLFVVRRVAANGRSVR
jgi:hypothetical protein